MIACRAPLAPFAALLALTVGARAGAELAAEVPEAAARAEAQAEPEVPAEPELEVEPGPEPAADPEVSGAPEERPAAGSDLSWDSALALARAAAMEARVGGAAVEFRTPWASGRGVLVGDARTVVVLARIPHTGRRITVRRAGSTGPEARVLRVRTTSGVHRGGGFAVLDLDRDLPGEPLQTSPRPPELGERVYVAVGGGPEGLAEGPAEMAETSVTASSASTLALGTASGQVPAGAPVLDAEGNLAGLYSHAGYAIRASEVLSDEALHERGVPLLPAVGVRLGTEFGGFLDQPFVMDLDLGLALWDQLGLGLRLGFGLGTEDTYRIPANVVHGAGVVEAHHSTFNLGFELEYRVLLSRAPMPFYLDLAVGVTYVAYIVNTRGPALYSAEPGCDPALEQCPLVIGEPPRRAVEHAVGASVGADVRVGALVMGYRFIPRALAHNLSDVHHITFGISVF